MNIYYSTYTFLVFTKISTKNIFKPSKVHFILLHIHCVAYNKDIFVVKNDNILEHSSIVSIEFLQIHGCKLYIHANHSDNCSTK